MVFIEALGYYLKMYLSADEDGYNIIHYLHYKKNINISLYLLLMPP